MENDNNIDNLLNEYFVVSARYRILHSLFYTFSNEIHLFKFLSLIFVLFWQKNLKTPFGSGLSRLGNCHSESVKYFHDHMKDAFFYCKTSMLHTGMEHAFFCVEKSLLFYEKKDNRTFRITKYGKILGRFNE